MALKWLLNSAFTEVFSGYGMVSNSVAVQRSEVIACPKNNNGEVTRKEEYPNGFQVPLHYPRYKKADYEKMEEWRLDMLLKEYGLSFKGTLHQKRAFAMGAFLWPDQL
ncbi:hypothetical protein JCGZ_01047 [Jatropha curcas]|uniref:DUF7722 domain-containing protein n=1 Tax=Jatropha curcas TaxID=180498 RepID=A0A067L474_JATCU|nr:uncharacterized protein LOC105633102 [Jatropha curcas]KDP39290.1 hypothetical protein JCGZ_01047 [Jatropha curcas]